MRSARHLACMEGAVQIGMPSMLGVQDGLADPVYLSARLQALMWAVREQAHAAMRNPLPSSAVPLADHRVELT